MKTSERDWLASNNERAFSAPPMLGAPCLRKGCDTVKGRGGGVRGRSNANKKQEKRKKKKEQ